jgi:hypothetical protein
LRIAEEADPVGGVAVAGVAVAASEDLAEAAAGVAVVSEDLAEAAAAAVALEEVGKVYFLD